MRNTELTTKFLHRKTRQGPFLAQEQQDKPNILFITVDMISPDCYRSGRPLAEIIQTPHMDEIAQQGTSFEHAFTTSPLCGPARAAMFTGMCPPYIANEERAPSGVLGDLTPNDFIFQDYLKAQGYCVKHAGKSHVGTEKFIQTFGENVHAWNRWAPPLQDDDRYLDYIDNLGVQLPRYRKEIYGLQTDKSSKGNSFGGWIEQQNGEDFPKNAHYTAFLTDLTRKQILAAKRQDPDKPFFCELDIFDPHQPYSIPSGFEKRYEEIKGAIQPPASFDKLEGSLPNNPIYELYRQYWGIYDQDTILDYIAGHLLQVELIDYAIGNLTQFLKDEGLWDNTCILFSADHGDMGGRLGMADKGVYFQPDIFSVPLYIKLPKSYQHKTKVCTETVSSLDIAPTLLQIAGIEKPLQMEGSSLIDIIQGGHYQGHAHIYQTGLHVGTNLGVGFQIQSAGKRWFYGYHSTTGYQELYDLDQDEQINVFNDADKQSLREEIAIKGQRLLSNDPRFAGYWASFRLHNMHLLPTQSSEDMQMFKPKE